MFVIKYTENGIKMRAETFRNIKFECGGTVIEGIRTELNE